MLYSNPTKLKPSMKKKSASIHVVSDSNITTSYNKNFFYVGNEPNKTKLKHEKQSASIHAVFDLNITNITEN